MKSSPTYLVVGRHPWNRATFDERLRHRPGLWRYTDDPHDITVERLSALDPRMVFFLHWSRRVPQEVVEAFECVCFHMTDLPFGRGGTPLQNLVVRGYTESKLTAFRMTAELDAGPVYLKEPLSLAGRAQEVYERASDLSAGMIAEIIERSISPEPQEGEVVEFRRRTPEESEMPRSPVSLEGIYDFIRMLDAEGYPRAFLPWGRLRLEFDHAALRDDRVEARVSIQLDEEA